MKRLAYRFANLIYDTLSSNYNIEFVTDHGIYIEKFGDTEGDITLKISLQPHINRYDIQKYMNIEQDDLSDDRWEEFYDIIRDLRITNFDDLLCDLNYDIEKRIKDKYPNENLDDYTLEYFNFTTTKFDDEYINLKIDARLIR